MRHIKTNEILKSNLISNINFFIAITLLFKISLFAQHLEKKEVPFTLRDSTKGMVDYQYIVHKKDTLYNGNFNFKHVRYSMQENTINVVEYQGVYKKAVKNGNWRYFNKYLIEDKNNYIEDFQIIHKASGESFQIQGFFKEGLADGNWQLVHQKIADSKPIDTLLCLNASFNSGKLLGEMRGKDSIVDFKISFDKESFSEKTWKFTHKLNNGKNITEFRVYENGILKNHFFTIDGHEVGVNHVGLLGQVSDDEELWKQVTIKDDYFKIISFANTGFSPKDAYVNFNSNELERLIQNTNRTLKKSLIAFKEYQSASIWDMLPGDSKIDLPLFKVRKFPFEQGEKKKLDKLSEMVKRLEFDIQEFLNSPQLQVGKYADKELNYRYQRIRIHKEQVYKLIELVNHIKNPAFEFVNRKEIFSYIGPRITYPLRIEYEFKEQKFEQNSSFTFDKSFHLYELDEILESVQLIKKDLDGVLEKSNKILERFKNQKELQAQEEELIAKKDQLIAFFDIKNKSDDFNAYHEQIADDIILFVEKSFKEYAALSIEDKKQKISVYIKCFDNILWVYEHWKTIPTRVKRLDELYTRTTWNPYTFTNMSERVKSRVYEAYEILFPYLIQDFINNISCETVDSKSKNIQRLYTRMLDLREQDTKTLERSIRRIKDPMVLLEQLEIDVK
jgi:hypothetical protein